MYWDNFKDILYSKITINLRVEEQMVAKTHPYTFRTKVFRNHIHIPNSYLCHYHLIVSSEVWHFNELRFIVCSEFTPTKTQFLSGWISTRREVSCLWKELLSVCYEVYLWLFCWNFPGAATHLFWDWLNWDSNFYVKFRRHSSSIVFSFK